MRWVELAAPEVGSGPVETLWRVGRQRCRGKPAAEMAADSCRRRGKEAAGAVATSALRQAVGGGRGAGVVAAEAAAATPHAESL